MDFPRVRSDGCEICGRSNQKLRPLVTYPGGRIVARGRPGWRARRVVYVCDRHQDGGAVPTPNTTTMAGTSEMPATGAALRKPRRTCDQH
jgi:hypothetical protein